MYFLYYMYVFNVYGIQIKLVKCMVIYVRVSPNFYILIIFTKILLNDTFLYSVLWYTSRVRVVCVWILLFNVVSGYTWQCTVEMTTKTWK